MGNQEKFTMPRHWCELVSPYCPFRQHGSCGVSIYLSRIQDRKKRREQAIELMDTLPDHRDELIAICERGLYG